MSEFKGNQTIIISGNPLESRFEIIIPPFRPINMFELEDDFENVVEEIENNVMNEEVSEVIIHFITAFKDSIEKEEIVPLLDYFLNSNIKGLEADDMKLIFDALREYIHYSTNEERLMN